MKNVKDVLPRPAIPLSASVRTRVLSEYGARSETVTQNTGAILTTYILATLTVKKLAEEPRQTKEQKETNEKSAILQDIFEQFRKSQESERSQFSFMNEEINTEDPPVSLGPQASPR